MRHYGILRIIEMHLNRRMADVAESHAIGYDGKEGDERYMAEGIGEDCPRN